MKKNNKKIVLPIILFVSCLSVLGNKFFNQCRSTIQERILNNENASEENNKGKESKEAAGEIKQNIKGAPVSINEDLDQFLKTLTDTSEEYQDVLAEEVTFDYEANGYSKTQRTNNFLSIKTKDYIDINGNDVTADLFYIGINKKLDHPNLGQAILLYQAIRYKICNPDDYNEINITTFRFSIIAGFCIVPSSPYYGTMKSMPDTKIDKDGFVRMSHLVTIAAKVGIKVNVIAQLSGYSDYGSEKNPATFFKSVLNESCFAKCGLSSKKVGDFLDYRACEWISYEGKAASDMYHFKTCNVLHYLDNDGVVRNYGVYLSSANIDGVHKRGVAGLVSSQSGIIITNHRYIYLCARNFVRFSLDYVGYDMASDFRNEYITIIKKQKLLIEERGYDYLSEEIMIYLGSENDPVFEFYITPLDGSVGMWSDDNPFCRFVTKLQRSREHIGFKWNNPKSSMTYEFINTFFKIVKKAYKKDRGQIENIQNNLAIKMVGFDKTFFDDLIVGQHLGSKTILNSSGICHEKDCVFLYEEGGIRNSVALINSLNEHQGAFWYQVNQLLVVKENVHTGTDLVNTLYDAM